MCSEQNLKELEVNSKEKFGKVINMWEYNNMLLNNKRIKEGFTKKVRKHVEMNEKQIIYYIYEMK